MNKQSTYSLLSGFAAVLCLVLVAACAAPPSLNPSLAPTAANITIENTVESTVESAGQILPPLLTSGPDGTIQPGLAQTWSSHVTDDGRFVQYDFSLPADLPVDDGNSPSIEDISVAIQEVADVLWDDPGYISAGLPGGNDCVVWPPVPLSVLPGADDDHTISITTPRSEDCQSGDDASCADPVINFAANVPIFDPDTYTFKWVTEDGLYILEDEAGELIAWNPATQSKSRCAGPECQKPAGPKTKPICTPVPKPGQ